MSDTWATVNVSVLADKHSTIEAEDSYSLEIHMSEADARKYVEESLRDGGRTVALFKLEGLYRVSAIERLQRGARET